MRLAKHTLALVVATALGLGLAAPARSVYAADGQNPSNDVINNLLQSVNNQQNTAPAPVPPAPVVPAQAPFGQVPVAQPQAAPLTYESFPAFAAMLGFETKKLGEASYQIDLVRDGWTLYTQIWIDKVNNKVWLIAYLREIPDLDKVPALAYQRLLESNCLIGPTHFYMSKKNLFVGRPFENENITAVRFRRELDQFFSDCQKTENLWDVSKWSELATAPVAPAAPLAPPAPPTP